MTPGILQMFVAGASRLDLTLTPTMLERFGQYEELLRDWNRRINLISRKDTERIITYHCLDSLTGSGLIPPGSAVADIGTGAGLPGIPLKIVRDDISLTLVESIQKKVAFLDAAVRHLGLTRTDVLRARAEEMRDRTFDVILTRLVGKIREILPAARRLLAPGGRFIFYKGETAPEEIEQAQKVMRRLHLRVIETRDYRFTTPELFLRRLVVVGKDKG
jgi:16S rRNA (guanine527-N7)-methyltransferase